MSKIDALINAKKSLPDCQRKREIEAEIQALKSEMLMSENKEPSILVKCTGKVIGRLDFNKSEGSWSFKANDGALTEIGFYYSDVKSWAALNGYQLKVESI